MRGPVGLVHRQSDSLVKADPWIVVPAEAGTHRPGQGRGLPPARE